VPLAELPLVIPEELEELVRALEALFVRRGIPKANGAGGRRGRKFTNTWDLAWDTVVGVEENGVMVLRKISEIKDECGVVCLFARPDATTYHPLTFDGEYPVIQDWNWWTMHRFDVDKLLIDAAGDTSGWKVLEKRSERPAPKANGEAPQVEVETPEKARFNLIPYDELMNMPDPDWLIEGALVAEESNLIFGASNTFKSFIAVDMACSVAVGRPWHDKPVKQGRVLYIATEGGKGVGKVRIRGWMDRYKISKKLRRNMWFLKDQIKLTTKADVDALVARLKELGDDFVLIIIDVAAGTMDGSEASDEVVKVWVNANERIIEEIGAATLTITHTGWADQTRGRGHTHLWGSFNGRLKADGDAKEKWATLIVERFKDADGGEKYGFKMEPHDFDDGQYQTLIPVLDGQIAGRVAKSVTRLSKHQKIAIDALDRALLKHGQIQAETGFTIVRTDLWVEMAISAYPHEDAKRRSQAFREADKALRIKGLIGDIGSNVYRAV
jgi:hypothetical protein